ncbi:MAG TPA: hypothetical protein DCZ92_05380, partial [Elusimicrobia bacterium]|nr:hypothetical protein [Elusimicrobiota bacterium]
DAVKKAFDRAEPSREVEVDLFPIESRVAKIVKLMEGREWLLLDEVFASETKRLGVITCFMALLELVKQRKILISQDDAYGEVRMYPAPPQPAAAAPAADAPGAQPELPLTAENNGGAAK